MPRGRPRKNAKKQALTEVTDGEQDVVDRIDEESQDAEDERQSAAIGAIRDMGIQQLLTQIQLLRSNFTKEQLQAPFLEFIKENLQRVSIVQPTEGQYEVQWKENNGNISLNQADDTTLDAALLHRLTTDYPDYSTGISSLGGFQFSSQSVKTAGFGVENLHIRRMDLEEQGDSQMSDMKNGMQTPDISNNRLSVGMTPKTLRLPKQGEMLLSVHGSPLGVFKEDNMETIKKTEDD